MSLTPSEKSNNSITVDMSNTYPQLDDASYNNPTTTSSQNKPGLVGVDANGLRLVSDEDSVLLYEYAKCKRNDIELNIPSIESALGKSYIDVKNDHMSANSLDVLSFYIKGQKLLYTEAKTYCEQQLNFLMLPAIFISCVGSIFSFVADEYNYGPVIIASLNGFNAFLLAVISYLKLDAKSQAHKTSAYKFEKLESFCEFNSGKVMFFSASEEDILSAIDKIEKDVEEIKETNQFILPESIRYEFHYTYSTNIFTMVKRMYLAEVSETNNLRNCINKLSSLNAQIDLAKMEGRQDIIKELGELIHLEEKKKSIIIDAIFKCRYNYYKMDDKFNEEIKRHMRRVNKWFITRMICCDWLKS